MRVRPHERLPGDVLILGRRWPTDLLWPTFWSGLFLFSLWASYHDFRFTQRMLDNFKNPGKGVVVSFSPTSIETVERRAKGARVSFFVVLALTALVLPCSAWKAYRGLQNARLAPKEEPATPKIRPSVPITFPQEEKRLVGCSPSSALRRIREYAHERGFDFTPMPGTSADSFVCRKRTTRWSDIADPAHFKHLVFRLEPHTQGTVITISLSSFSWARAALSVLVTACLSAFCYRLASIEAAPNPSQAYEPLLMPAVSLIGLSLIILAVTEAISDFPFRSFVDNLYSSSRSTWEGLEIQQSQISNLLANMELAPLALGGLLIYFYAVQHAPNLFGIPLSNLRGPVGTERIFALGAAALVAMALLKAARPMLSLRINFLMQAFMFNFGLALYLLNWDVWVYLVRTIGRAPHDTKNLAQILTALSTVAIFGVAALLVLKAVEMSSRQAESFERAQAQQKDSILKQALGATASFELFAAFAIFLWVVLSVFNISWALKALLGIVYPKIFLDGLRFYSRPGLDIREAYIHIFAYVPRAIPMLVLLWLIVRKYLNEIRIARLKMHDMTSDETEQVRPILERLAKHLQIQIPRIRVLQEDYIDAYISILQELVITRRTLSEFSGEAMEALLAHEMWHLKTHGPQYAAATLVSDWTFFGYGPLAALQDSHKMEFEADGFATEWCLGRGISPQVLKNVLVQIDAVNAAVQQPGERPLGIIHLCLRKERMPEASNENPVWHKRVWEQLQLFYRLYFLGEIVTYFHPTLSERAARIDLVKER